MSGKKSWPVDTLLLFCPRPHEKRNEPLGGSVDTSCRDCGANLIASLDSFKKAIMLAVEHQIGHIQNVCVACGVKYQSPTVLVDDRQQGLAAKAEGGEEVECPKCGNEGSSPHVCPYKQEIIDSSDQCRCCDDCRLECVYDV